MNRNQEWVSFGRWYRMKWAAGCFEMRDLDGVTSRKAERWGEEICFDASDAVAWDVEEGGSDSADLEKLVRRGELGSLAWSD